MAVLVDPNDLSKTVLVGSLLPKEEKRELIELLKQNLDVFAWTHEDMLGVDPTESVHRLGVRTNAKPVKHKRRRFTLERNKVINDDVDRLLANGMVREVQYSDWIVGQEASLLQSRSTSSKLFSFVLFFCFVNSIR